MTRAEIKDILTQYVANVVFTKVDGSTRVMKCTLISAFLPPLEGSSNKRSDKVLPVWDLEADAWRSFRIDSVQKVTLTKWEQF
jgi:hypothetical protein